jgi:hypothetical protein
LVEAQLTCFHRERTRDEVEILLAVDDRVGIELELNLVAAGLEIADAIPGLARPKVGERLEDEGILVSTAVQPVRAPAADDLVLAAVAEDLVASVPPSMQSFPEPPERMSLPPSPKMMSSPELPSTRSLPPRP